MGGVVLPAQLRQEAGGNIQGGGGGGPLPDQLEAQTLRQVSGRHTGGLQALEGVQSLLDERLGDLELRQAVQVFLKQIAVLIHQLGHIGAKSQQGLWQTEPLQLIPEEGLQALGLPVGTSLFRRGLGVVGEGGAVCTGIQPCGLPAQLLIGLAQLRGLLLLQQGVFLGGPVQILCQLLAVHLQDLHGLKQLGRKLELLPQFRFQRD